MNRAILLQTDATSSKRKILKDFSMKAVELANFLLSKRESKRLMDLHKAMYSVCKETTSFGSQVICDIERCVVRTKGTTLKNITVKFNVPRNCKTFETKSYLFVQFVPYARKPIAIPIRKNRNYQRYNSLIQSGWTCKTYGLTTDGQVVAFLSKEQEITSRSNIVGVDVNSKCFAVSVLTPEGRVLKQLYYGKDIWVKRKRIFKRREVLQSYADLGSHKAVQKLHLLKTREQNFVKNRVGEVVRDITNLALRYDADIGIEELKRFKPVGRKVNKEILSIPFYQFRTNLESGCFDKNITLHVVDAYHTSKWCSHCGAVAKSGHVSNNYALFRCSCGQVVNSDRKASLAIAVKTLLVQSKHTPQQSNASMQFTSRRVPVNGLFRHSGDGFGSCVAVHPESTPMESHLTC